MPQHRRPLLPVLTLAALATSHVAHAAGPGSALETAGIALGMTAQQAKAVIARDAALTPLALDPANTDAVYHRQELTAPVELYQQSRTKAQAAPGQQSFAVYFTGQPANPVVWKLSRRASFESGKQPAAATLLAALKEKYGMPAREEPTRLSWVYGANGQAITGKEGARLFSRCASNGVWQLNFVPGQYSHHFRSLVNFPNDRARIAPAPECRNLRFASAQVQVAGALASELQVALMDVALGYPALTANLGLIDQQIAGSQTNQLQRAQQVKPVL